jgi:hypothetical protein
MRTGCGTVDEKGRTGLNWAEDDIGRAELYVYSSSFHPVNVLATT